MTYFDGNDPVLYKIYKTGSFYLYRIRSENDWKSADKYDIMIADE